MQDKFNLLLVDDDELFLLLNAREIKKSGFHQNPISFTNAQDALAFLEKQETLATLILLDINMPGVDGWGFLDRLSNNPKFDHIKVVMATSSADPNDKLKAKRYLSVVGFIEKPLDKAAMELLKNNPEVLAMRN